MTRKSTISKYIVLLQNRFNLLPGSFTKTNFQNNITGTPKFFDTLFDNGWIKEESDGLYSFVNEDYSQYYSDMANLIKQNQDEYIEKRNSERNAKNNILKDFSVKELVSELKTRGEFKVVRYIKTEEEL